MHFLSFLEGLKFNHGLFDISTAQTCFLEVNEAYRNDPSRRIINKWTSAPYPPSKGHDCSLTESVLYHALNFSMDELLTIELDEESQIDMESTVLGHVNAYCTTRGRPLQMDLASNIRHKFDVWKDVTVIASMLYHADMTFEIIDEYIDEPLCQIRYPAFLTLPKTEFRLSNVFHPPASSATRAVSQPQDSRKRSRDIEGSSRPLPPRKRVFFHPSESATITRPPGSEPAKQESRLVYTFNWYDTKGAHKMMSPPSGWLDWIKENPSGATWLIMDDIRLQSPTEMSLKARKAKGAFHSMPRRMIDSLVVLATPAPQNASGMSENRDATKASTNNESASTSTAADKNVPPPPSPLKEAPAQDGASPPHSDVYSPGLSDVEYEEDMSLTEPLGRLLPSRSNESMNASPELGTSELLLVTLPPLLTGEAHKEEAKIRSLPSLATIMDLPPLELPSPFLKSREVVEKKEQQVLSPLKLPIQAFESKETSHPCNENNPQASLLFSPSGPREATNILRSQYSDHYDSETDVGSPPLRWPPYPKFASQFPRTIQALPDIDNVESSALFAGTDFGEVRPTMTSAAPTIPTKTQDPIPHTQVYLKGYYCPETSVIREVNGEPETDKTLDVAPDAIQSPQQYAQSNHFAGNIDSPRTKRIQYNALARLQRRGVESPLIVGGGCADNDGDVFNGGPNGSLSPRPQPLIRGQLEFDEVRGIFLAPKKVRRV